MVLASARLLAIVLAVLAGNVEAQSPRTDPARRNVLILNGADANLPVFVAADRGLRGELRAAFGEDVNVFVESLDLFRFPSEQIEAELEALLRKKYAHIKIDVVAAWGRLARVFAERHVDAFWPGAAIVFFGEPTLGGRELASSRRSTGVSQEFDNAGTVALALRLLPATRRIVVVGGASQNDQVIIGQAREGLKRYEGGFAIDYLAGLSLPDTLARLRDSPPDAVILFLTMAQDGAGLPHRGVEMAREIATASPVPVFGWFDTYMGAGIVGGAQGGFEAEGRKAGDVIIRVLNGERPADIAVQHLNLSNCAVDARQLGRFGISESSLPDGCSVKFRPESPWDRYRWQILGVIAIILAQAALIAALLFQRRRRQRAELAVQEHRVELAHATRLATVGELTASIAHQVNQPLGAILANVHSADMLLEAGNADSEEVRRILAEIREEDLRASEVILHLRSLLAKHELARQSIDLNATIAEVIRLLDAEARRRHVELATRFDSNLPQVFGDRVHLQQVIMNLVINAMDAMVDTHVASRRVLVQTSPRADGAVEVAVADSGCGIAADSLSQLFKPYFTTKNRGMGLGLSIARTIVEAHGGKIWADADREGGAVFRFTLPAAAASGQLPTKEPMA